MESIAAKQRTAKVNMALAKLCKYVGHDRAAVTAYKEVLRECPFSLEACRGLLALAMKTPEVLAHVTSALQQTVPDWLVST